jgi:hypothetical protein
MSCYAEQENNESSFSKYTTGTRDVNRKISLFAAMAYFKTALRSFTRV